MEGGTILADNINSPPVEVSIGFLSGYFLCFVVTGTSDTSSKGKATIKCMCSSLNCLFSSSAYVFPKNHIIRCKDIPYW